jgi:hypothetical protein
MEMMKVSFGLNDLRSLTIVVERSLISQRKILGGWTEISRTTVRSFGRDGKTECSEGWNKGSAANEEANVVL